MARHIEAIGGKAALQRVQDRVETWSLTLDTGDTQMKGDVSIKVKNPDRYQVVLRVDRAGVPVRVILSYDGDAGWEETGGKTRPVRGEELTEFRNRALRADLGYSLRLEDLGEKATFKGKEDLDGKPVYVLEITPKKGEAVTYYLDSETYLVSKVAGTTSQQGMVVDSETWLTSYREVEGVRIPDRMDVLRTVAEVDREHLYKLELQEVKFNTGIQDSEFAPSEVRAATPPPPKLKKRGWY